MCEYCRRAPSAHALRLERVPFKRRNIPHRQIANLVHRGDNRLHITLGRLRLGSLRLCRNFRFYFGRVRLFRLCLQLRRRIFLLRSAASALGSVRLFKSHVKINSTRDFSDAKHPTAASCDSRNRNSLANAATAGETRTTPGVLRSIPSLCVLREYSPDIKT